MSRGEGDESAQRHQEATLRGAGFQQDQSHGASLAPNSATSGLTEKVQSVAEAYVRAKARLKIIATGHEHDTPLGDEPLTVERMERCLELAYSSAQVQVDA